MEHFDTGPFTGMNIFAPVEERLEWLRRERPDYFATYSESLEHLGFAAGDERPAEGIKAIIAMSEQLTPGMQSYVERVFGAPVYQHYALSEIELVATRCEAGRYHVHREHCFVEIVDEEGRACRSGQTGRIVVTSLTNFAMPLLRYDTGDLAQVTEGACSCNRTLPSFGKIVGRYSRVAHLPDGTLPLVFAIRDAIEQMPTDLMGGLREFQIHQLRDQSMELRIVARSSMRPEFYARIREVWTKFKTDSESEIIFRSVDALSKSASGKCEVFTSDFTPAAAEGVSDSTAFKD
jgi:phenylacetate-CoA ligase